MIVKLGIIGTGNMGKNHVRIAREMINCFDLVAVYDPDQTRIEALGLSDIAVGSEEELIEKADYVIIASDINVDTDRFFGKKIFFCGTNEAIDNPQKVIETAMKESKV